MPALDAPDSLNSWRPRARLDHLMMTQVGEEVLVYDETTHAIHHLNPTSHLVWTLCDGTRTLTVIGQVAGAALGAEVSDVVVRLALSQLAGANLLVGAAPTEIQQPRHSRQAVLRRMAVHAVGGQTAFLLWTARHLTPAARCS